MPFKRFLNEGDRLVVEWIKDYEKRETEGVVKIEDGKYYIVTDDGKKYELNSKHLKRVRKL